MLLAVVFMKYINTALTPENNKPKGIIDVSFLNTSLIPNRGFIAIVETIPTIKKSNANNPINKYVLFTSLNKLNIRGINDKMNKTTKLLDVLSAIFYPSIKF